MRPSSRESILEAAFRLAGEADGAAQITFDATAREAGVTKGGVQYHFRTREALVLAITDYVARRCDAAMLEALGKPFEKATAAERTAAYVQVVAAGRLTRADLAVYAEALAEPAFAAPWNAVMQRWFDLDLVDDAAERARLTIARLAADGLWLAEATESNAPLSRDREPVVAYLLSLTEVSR